MNEPVVTLTGNVGTTPERSEAGDAVLTKFRLGCTPRRYNREKDTWVDGDTQWYSVNAWRRLGENVLASIKLGDPVIVHGKLIATSWTNKAGMSVTTFDVDATQIGHDLNRGTATFTRPERGEGTEAGGEEDGSRAGVDDVAAAQELAGVGIG